MPTDGFVGEPLSFSVSFDNTDTTDPGYGPYVDLILPAAGADGAGVAVDDGITFNSATYLGNGLTPIIPPFICSGGSFNHPLTGLATGLYQRYPGRHSTPTVRQASPRRSRQPQSILVQMSATWPTLAPG